MTKIGLAARPWSNTPMNEHNVLFHRPWRHSPKAKPPKTVGPPKTAKTVENGGKRSTLRGERLDRRVDATRCERHAGRLHREFRRGQAAEQHRLVQVAEMADAEHLAHQRPQPAAQRQV